MSATPRRYEARAVFTAKDVAGENRYTVRFEDEGGELFTKEEAEAAARQATALPALVAAAQAALASLLEPTKGQAETLKLLRAALKLVEGKP